MWLIEQVQIFLFQQLHQCSKLMIGLQNGFEFAEDDSFDE